MIFIAPDLLTPALLVFSLSFLGFGFLISKNRRKSVIVLIIAITIIIGVYQTTLNNDLLALDQGEILEVGFLQADYSANITAGGTHLSPQLSNWYTVFNLSVIIEINTSVILFSLVELSHPETRFHENNFSTSMLESHFPYFGLSFQLPFLYTADGGVANWVFSFFNPTNSTTNLNYIVHAGVSEDAGVYQMVFTEHYYTLPGKLLITFYVAVGLAVAVLYLARYLRTFLNSDTEKTLGLLNMYE